MARSAYVYVVTDGLDAVIAGFTVKKECVAWLLKTALDCKQVVRIRDGDNVHPIISFSVEEFLKEAGK